MTAVDVVVGLLMALGLVGAILPFLPGTPLILAGALVHAIATGFEPIGFGRLAILVTLAVISETAAWAGTALGARRLGASRWGIAGAIAGALLGLPFAPVGLVLGPLVGAMLAELARTGRLAQSARGGLGAVLGLVVGTAAHVALAAVMVALFYWWVARR